MDLARESRLAPFKGNLMKRMALFLVSISLIGATGLYAQSSTDLDDLMRRGDVYLQPETREAFLPVPFLRDSKKG
ncbi:MAG: hypothetical protein Ct9H300mP15_29680 [Gemmatimonadota bacterium]|nr:MAG: hypothetical protein Ct9H300mP15_29680 [Gemmatimonadota bacterium]